MSKPKLFFDNIVFELQRIGGISKIWHKKILYFKENTDFDIKYIEGSNINRNYFRRRLNIEEKDIKKESSLPLMIRRYLPVNVVGRGLFHSSYFRITDNSKIRQVITVHDCIYEKFSGGYKKKIHLTQKIKALKFADAIICVSKSTKKDLLLFYPWVDENKIHTIYNGVDNEYHILKKEHDEIKIKNTVIQNKKFILYVGGRNKHKNFDSILNLLNSDTSIENNLCIVVVGGGIPTKQEIRKIRNLNLFKKVNFIGHVTNDELNILYNMAFCLVFPSFYEGFGLPVIEAMRAGCPVLSSDRSSLPEIIGRKGLFFNPNDSVEIKEKFDLLLNDKFRIDLIDYGLKKSKEYSWENSFDAIFKLHNNLV